MTKFNDKSLGKFPLAYFYSTMQAFDSRMAKVETSIERLNTMKAEQHRLFLAFDDAYKRSLKSQVTKSISDLDKKRDQRAYIIMKVADLWANKLDEDELNIHGRRVAQVFKDFSFRIDEALVAENAKLRNIEQVLNAEPQKTDLEVMGLAGLNQQLQELSEQIEQQMAQRNEEQSAIIVGEVKQTRDALDAHYRSLLTLLNAVQELQPEEALSQAAQFYNQDLHKIELQISQSRKGGSTSKKPASDTGDATGGTTGTGTGTGVGTITPSTGGGTTGGDTTGSGSSDDEPSGGSQGSDDNPGGGSGGDGLDE